MLLLLLLFFFIFILHFLSNLFWVPLKLKIANVMKQKNKKICLKVAKGWTKSKIKVTQNDFVNLIWVTKEAKVNKMQLKVSRYFLFNQFHIRLLDYSILLKARHNELIHELIILHNHELIPRSYKAIIRFQLNNKR